MSTPDWRAILAEQGIDPAVADQAVATAEAVAAFVATLPHDPTEAAGPVDIVPVLLAGAAETEGGR